MFKSAGDIDHVEHAINADLKKVDEWYEFNQMKRNHSKYQAIAVFIRLTALGAY